MIIVIKCIIKIITIISHDAVSLETKPGINVAIITESRVLSPKIKKF